MKIDGKVHCFFEQSGTFKNEFKKLGIPAEDYDIQNNFGETDHVVDLFSEIEKEYDNLTQNAERRTLFAKINPCQDLVIAFFPCIYFCATSQMAFYLGYTNYSCLTDMEKIEMILKRNDNRSLFYQRLIKFVAVCLALNIRMVFENPWSEQTYLKANFLKAPDVVDMNRMQRGDFYQKPTAYWFWNCEPTHGYSFQKKTPIPVNSIDDRNRHKNYNELREKGVCVCSEEKSCMTSDYARNFICDFVLGKEQDLNNGMLF